MIYVITDNNYLFESIRYAMHPLIAQKATVENILKQDFLWDGDVVLIDDNIALRNYDFEFKNSKRKFSVVFLNTVRNSNIDFLRVHYTYHMLKRNIRLKDFRTKMMKILTGKIRTPVRNYKTMLSERERQILRASIHGYSIRDIARATGLKEKTVYNYRKSACIKLGATRFLDLVPFTSSFMVAASLQSICSTHSEPDCIL